MGFLVDLIELGERRTNDALEMMCKSGHDHDEGIWAPMDSPFIARLVELFTQRGLDRLEGFRVELLAWQQGQRHRPGPVQPRPEGAMERWSPAELALVKLYLEHLPPEQWTIDDHMMSVDFLCQRYLPADDMRTEAEWLVSRAALMGRVQASMENLTARQADRILAAPPPTAGPTPAQAAIMDFARSRSAENVRKFADDVRHRMRGVIAQHVEARVLAAPGSGRSLETELLDAFGISNRDWRRIAVTEAGEAQTQGFVASLPVGAKVKRVEQYRGACKFCRKIDGRVMEVVDPAREEKNPETMIWLGKTNIGRSASPRKRVGDQLVEREPHEMWQIPVGLVHPHCRGRWVPALQDKEGHDPEFGAWLRSMIAEKTKKVVG